MNDSSSADTTSVTWRWNSESRRLRIDTKDAVYRDLAGDWSLSGVSVLLEGMSRGRLTRALDAGMGRVNCQLTLSNGRRVKLVGAFNEPGHAAGVLLQDEDGDMEQAEPGPDLQPVYQPIIDLSDGRVVGFEALARWSGDGFERGDRLEDAALASNMLIQAAETLADWRQTPAQSHLFVHVNLTGRDLAQGGVPDLVEALVQGHNLPNGALKIELTEQAALRDASAAREVALQIKQAGAGVILDDFGSGHSSFAWLADIPADGLKIDPDLTRRLGETRTDTILEAITLLGRRLGMTSTAEGVESRADAARLRALGFDYVQGFAFARPMKRDAAATFLTNQARPDIA